MGVEQIVIPSVREMAEELAEELRVHKKITNLNTLMFPNTTRLQKVVRKVKKVMLHHDLNLIQKVEVE